MGLIIESDYESVSEWAANYVAALQMHPKAIIVCDDPACMQIKVGIYRYYKDIESGNIDFSSLLL